MTSNILAFWGFLKTTDSTIGTSVNPSTAISIPNLPLKPQPISLNTELKYLSYCDEYAPAKRWQSALTSRIKELSFLRADWDAGGANPPNGLAASSSENFAYLLIDKNLKPQHVSPSVEEGITFSFRSGSKYAAVEFLNDDSIGMVLSEENEEPVIRLLRSEEGDLCVAIDELRVFLD